MKSNCDLLSKFYMYIFFLPRKLDNLENKILVIIISIAYLFMNFYLTDPENMTSDEFMNIYFNPLYTMQRMVFIIHSRIRNKYSKCFLLGHFKDYRPAFLFP